MSRSACVPENTGISIGIRLMYGLFKRTPKFLSPLSSNSMNTLMWIRPVFAILINKSFDFGFSF